jgi:hypothetical protein
MIFDSNFNIAKFLYYNPELTAFSNIRTNTIAYEWASSNDISMMVSNDSIIPQGFNSELFLCDYKRLLDASSLNNVIRLAMYNEGFSSNQINARGKYVETIGQDAMLTQENIFKFNFMPSASNYYITNSNLTVGDLIKFVDNVTNVTEYGQVISIIDNETFSVVNSKKTFDSVGKVYRIIGIKVWDIERLGKLNYMRGLTPPPEVPPENANPFLDTNFNPDLYRLLYPDAKSKDDYAAFLDYTSRRDNNEIRIGRTQDLPTDSNIFTPEFNNISVKYRLKLDNNAALQWSDKYIYGISKDIVTRASNLDPLNDHFVSEWGIKTYIDNPYITLATFSNMIVNGNVKFNGIVDYAVGFSVNDIIARSNAYIASNAFIGQDLIVYGNSRLVSSTCIQGSNNTIQNATMCNTIFSSNVVFDCDALMNKNLIVNKSYLGPRIGIGPPIDIIYTSNQEGLYDAKLKNADIKETLNVGLNLNQGTLALVVNGYISASNLDTTSDARYKHVNGILVYDEASNIVNNIHPVSYCAKGMPQSKIGFLADEIETTCSNAISKIAQYEINVCIPAHIDSNIITFDMQQTLQVGDQLYIQSVCLWVTITRIINDNQFYIDVSCDTKKTIVNINKLRLFNAKSVDYQQLLATLWCYTKGLEQRINLLEQK